MGRALRLEKAKGPRAEARLEKARGPSAAARVGERGTKMKGMGGGPEIQYWERHCNFEKGHFQNLCLWHFPSTT